MGENRRKPTLRVACICLFVLLGVMLRVAPALAETFDVSGTDTYFKGQKEVDILTVTGQEGKTV